ncbi:hypothetical protein C816_00567 [Oscillibacter sp. 1-3]|nr:hypothetical protein C816_00567 [Oscillibacter sp. 1-3]
MYGLAFPQHLPYFLQGFVYKFRKAGKRNNRGKSGKLGYKGRKVPVILCSICTGGQVADFRDLADGKFKEIMPIRDDRDFLEFLRLYLDEKSEIKREWGHMNHRLSALLDRLANLAAALLCFSQIAEVERISPGKMRKRLEGILCGAGMRMALNRASTDGPVSEAFL